MSEKCSLQEKKPGGISLLWRTEDWLAVWVGFLVMAGLIALFHWKVVDVKKIVPNFRWTTDGQIESRVPKWTETLNAVISDAQAKGEANAVERAGALKEALLKKDRKELAKAGGQLERLGRETVAGALGREVRQHAEATSGALFTWDNLSRVVYIGLAYLVIAAAGIRLLGGPVAKFLIGFPVVFALAWLSRLLAGNAFNIDLGIEYIVYALAIGLFISNVIGIPDWLKPAVQTEYYIKTGLVILGSGILFFEILQAGYLGIIQACLVIFVIWYFCFWFAKKLKVDDDFAAMLASGVSICGVSAAIATCGCVEGDKKKLSYTATLILLMAIPMMFLLPWFVHKFNISPLIGGAWMGGTIDTSAAVVAAGALIGDQAMKTAVIVKFTQNAFIGIAAFFLAFWWAFKRGAESGQRPTAGIIWDRFPKFVLGFLVGSAIFSFLLHIDTVTATRGAISELRVWWFSLAFVSIGLGASFKELSLMGGGRPALAFTVAQIVNVIWVLIIATLLYGGYIFPVPDIR